MAKKLRTYDMANNDHFNDFIAGYHEARVFLRRKKIKDATKLYTDLEDQVDGYTTVHNHTLDSLYDERNSETFNSEKANMLGIALAFRNFGIPLEEVKKDTKNAETLQKDLQNPAKLVKDYQQAAEDFDEFNFWDWIVSLFVDNGYDAAKKKKDELYNRIVKSHVLDRKLPTRNQIKKSEIEELPEGEVDTMNFDNFNNSLIAEHNMFDTMLKSFDRNQKNLETVDLRRYLDMHYNNENSIDIEINKIQDENLIEETNTLNLISGLKGKKRQEYLDVDLEKRINQEMKDREANKEKYPKYKHSEYDSFTQENIENEFKEYEEKGIADADDYVENNFSKDKVVKHNIVMNEVKDNMRQSSNQNTTSNENINENTLNK